MNAHDTPAVAREVSPRIGDYSRQSRSYINKFRRGRHDQRGAILVIALIMLLLLTIIGVSGLRGTTMEERMAGNMKEQYRAFQAAEFALRVAEAEINPKIPRIGTATPFTDDVNCADTVVDKLGDGDFTVITDTFSDNEDEIPPEYHARYCKYENPRIWRDNKGNPSCDPTVSDCVPRTIQPYTVIGVGRVPGNAVTALKSTYTVPE